MYFIKRNICHAGGQTILDHFYAENVMPLHTEFEVSRDEELNQAIFTRFTRTNDNWNMQHHAYTVHRNLSVKPFHSYA